MDQIYPDDGLLYLLRQMLGTGGWNYDLFVNNYTPTLDDVIGDYTLAAWSGYAQINVPTASFTFSQVAAHLGSLQAPNIVFTNGTGSPVSVYGYVIRDSTNTYIVASARFDGAPIVIPAGGNQLVTPILGDFSGLSS
jgi:hypothetical protein